MQLTLPSEPKFPLGALVVTPTALDTLCETDLRAGIVRHAAGDWGELCESDRVENEKALLEGRRLFSMYTDRHDHKFYVITECDRSVTTALLPEDY